jgi:hypothetical protein
MGHDLHTRKKITALCAVNAGAIRRIAGRPARGVGAKGRAPLPPVEGLLGLPIPLGGFRKRSCNNCRTPSWVRCRSALTVKIDKMIAAGADEDSWRDEEL